jgi:hypothetical protein
MTTNRKKNFCQIFTLSHIVSVEVSNNPNVLTEDAKYFGMCLDGKLTWRYYIEKMAEET